MEKEVNSEFLLNEGLRVNVEEEMLLLTGWLNIKIKDTEEASKRKHINR